MVSKNSIKSIKAREILDSRGNPTLEVEVVTPKDVFRAGVPSGASTGRYEAQELRDGGRRYNGRGVRKAVRNVNEAIAPKLKGKDVASQKDIDEAMIELDGTGNKSRLGANAITGVSMAVCRAGAASKKTPLHYFIGQFYRGPTPVQLTGVGPLKPFPRPCFNVINGGAHAGNDLDIQEFMVVPWFDHSAELGASELTTGRKFSENLRVGTEIYHELKSILRKTYGPPAVNVGDEGGFAPPMKKAQEALDAIMQAAKNLGYENKTQIILDVAASQFFKDGKYKMKTGVFTREGLLNFYGDLLEHYPIVGLEDPFEEEDWQSWKDLRFKTQDLSSEKIIIGDDLLVTNPKRIQQAHEKNACNAMILKVNQIGTVTEAMEATRLAKSYGWKIIVSHRSGETCDDFIADLAVGIGADYIKAGAPARGERVGKYNRLLKIADEIQSMKQ